MTVEELVYQPYRQEGDHMTEEGTEQAALEGQVMSPPSFQIERYRKDAETLLSTVGSLLPGRQAASITIAVQQLEVVDDATCEECMTLRNAAALAEKKIKDYWEPLRRTADDAKKKILTARDEMMKPWTDIRDLAQKKADAYAAACLAAKREADKRAEQLAAEERKRLAKAADKLLGEGKVAEAESLQLQAEVMKAPVLPSALPQIDNTRFTQKWKGEVTDVIAFLKDIVEGKQPLIFEHRGEQRAIVIIDEAVLNTVVGRHGPSLKWHGLTVSETVKAGARKL